MSREINFKIGFFFFKLHLNIKNGRILRHGQNEKKLKDRDFRAAVLCRIFAQNNGNPEKKKRGSEECDDGLYYFSVYSRSRRVRWPPVAWPCRVPGRRVSSARWTVSALCVPRPTVLDSTGLRCREEAAAAGAAWPGTVLRPSSSTVPCLRARPRRTCAPGTVGE